MLVDLRLLELLSSKICHDLVSPVGAINNGVELIADIGGAVTPEAMKLIGDSADLAARRLRLFRMTFGRAGSESGLSAQDARQIAQSIFSGGKITLDWPAHLPPEKMIAHPGAIKVLLNLLLVAEEALAFGGTIRLLPLARGELIGLSVQAEGTRNNFSADAHAALEARLPVEQLGPRTVQAYLTGRFAEHFGCRLAVEPQGEQLWLQLMI